MWNEKFIEKLHLSLRCWLRWRTESRPRRGRRRHQRPLEDTKSRSADLFNELTLVCFMRPCKRSPSCYQRSLSYSCQRAPAGLKLCIFQYALFLSAFLSPLNFFFRIEKHICLKNFNSSIIVSPLWVSQCQHHPNEADVWSVSRDSLRKTQKTAFCLYFERLCVWHSFSVTPVF